MTTDHESTAPHRTIYRLLRRVACGTTAAAIATPLLLGCTTTEATTSPPPSATAVASATAEPAVDGVIPVPVSAVRAPAGLRPGASVKILGVTEAAVDGMGVVGHVVAIRPHGDQLTIDLTPANSHLLIGTETATALANPPHPLTVIQLEAPEGDQ